MRYRIESYFVQDSSYRNGSIAIKKGQKAPRAKCVGEDMGRTSQGSSRLLPLKPPLGTVGFGVWGLGFRVFRVWGLGFGV